MNAKPRKYKVIDLFSGCGGMSWGLQKAGFETIAGIDNWDIALETFKLNHPDSLVYNTDIRDLDPKKVMSDLKIKSGELDCLVGGPPCQGFSKNVPASTRFLEDPRNQLFRDYLRFVNALFPKVLIMENVAEIHNAFNGKVREEIVNALEIMGYSVKVRVLFAPDFGIPQRRRRCFFFASRTDIKPEFPDFPTFKSSAMPRLLGDSRPIWFVTSAWEAISDLPSLKNGEGEEPIDYSISPKNNFQQLMRLDSKSIYDHIGKNLRPKQLARLASLKPGEALKQLPANLRPRSGYSGAYGRLDLKMIAGTITRWVFHPGSGRYGHPKDTRIITIREAARIQSFSDDFRFCGSYTEKAGQIGNAVPPLFMYALAPKIISCLDIVQKERRLLTQGAALVQV